MTKQNESLHTQSRHHSHQRCEMDRNWDLILDSVDRLRYSGHTEEEAPHTERVAHMHSIDPQILKAFFSTKHKNI